MAIVAVASLSVFAGCGSDGGSDTQGGADAETNSQENSADRATQQSGQGGGGTATLTIGSETWEFDGVQCAFGTDETQNEDWDFSLSAIQDGLQLSVSGGAPGGQYGDSIDLDDIQDFENPSVSWSAPPLSARLGVGDAGQVSILEIDGNNVTADTAFIDGNDPAGPSAEPVAGTLSADCG